MELPERAPQDTTPVTLTLDQKAVLARALSELLYTVQHFGKLAETDSLEKGLGQTMLYLAETPLSNICKTTGIETYPQAERDERYARLRAANHRIRELEAQLGEKVRPDDVGKALKNLSGTLNRWWDTYGFAHISEIKFSDWGTCSAVFSASLFGTTRLIGSKTPVSDKETRALWLSGLINQGFVLNEEEGRGDEGVVDCDKSRAVLFSLFKTHFPTAKITDFESHVTRKGVCLLRSFKVHFHSLDEIADSMPAEVLESA